MNETDRLKAAADIQRLSTQVLERRLDQLMGKEAKDHSDRDKAVIGLLRAELAKRK